VAEPVLSRAVTESSIAESAILAELDRIVSSNGFSRAERPARFLRHLVESTLGGQSHLLKEIVLGIDCFARPSSWDPRLDPVVRQEASRLRKRLAKYYADSAASPEVRIELPVGSYVPVFRPIASPVESPHADTLSVGQLSAIQASGEIPAARPRKLFYVGTSGVVIAALVISWLFISPWSAPTSIAVLPFTYLSADPTGQYFSEGLTDQITDSLSRLKTMRVIARSSAFKFKGRNVDVRQVGRELNVESVLEGSVERSGDRVRVVVRLERVSDGTHLWSNTYERTTNDLFSLEPELAKGIAASLKLKGDPAAPKHTPTPEAYDANLRGRYELQKATTDSLARAETEYQHAIDLDPGYADAYAGLATAKYNRFSARGSTYQTEEERNSIEGLFRKALGLDSGLAGARALQAGLAMQYRWDWDGAERELKIATAGGANSTAEGYYAFLLVFRGRFSEADEHLRRMVALDPFATATLNNLALARNLEGRYAQTREAAQRILAVYPNILAPQQFIGLTYIEEGHPDLALPLFQSLKPQLPQIVLYEAMAFAKAGDRHQALKLIDSFERKYPATDIPMQWLALVYAFMGDESNTMKWLERSADRHEFQAMNVAVHPVYASMRNSVRFSALKKRMGLE